MRFLLPQWKCTDRAPSAWPPVRPTPSARPPQPRKGGGSACPWPPDASEIPAGFMICTLEVVVSNMITKRVRTIFLASFAMESPIWLTRFWACPRRSGGAIVTGVVLFNFFCCFWLKCTLFRGRTCALALPALKVKWAKLTRLILASTPVELYNMWPFSEANFHFMGKRYCSKNEEVDWLLCQRDELEVTPACFHRKDVILFNMDSIFKAKEHFYLSAGWRKALKNMN